jgi:hypothetical protein
VIPIARSDFWFQSDWVCLAYDLGELCNRTRLEQYRQAEIDAKCLFDLAEESHYDQRLAAEFKKVVIQSDLVIS